MKKALLYIALFLLPFSVEAQSEPRLAHGSHRVLTGVGAGYGAVCQFGSIASQGDVSYAFFWNEHWGISLGLGLDYYRSRQTFSREYTIQEYVDTDREPMIHLLVNEQNMLRQHRLLVASLPLMLQMEYPLSKRETSRPVRLYSALGARLGYPLSHIQATTGDITQTGYYQKWQLTVRDIHEYGTISVHDRQSFPVCIPTILPQAEIGVSLPVSHQLAIGIGLYGNVSVWNKPDYLPWQVGARISIRWQSKPIQPTQPAKLAQPIQPVQLVQPVQPAQPALPSKPDFLPEPPMEPQPAPLPPSAILCFQLDSVTPTPASLPAIDEAAARLVANPRLHADIFGHTCHIGSFAYNEALSRRRAQAVANRLMQQGVLPEQLTIHACAYSVPFQNEPHDPALDRRVEIKFTDNQ